MKNPHYLLMTLLLTLAAGMPGCRPENDWTSSRDADPEMQELARKLEARAESLAIKDTVGSVAWLQGMQPMKVRGYGIVVGLGESGSAECPPEIRKSLVQEMRKRHHLGSRMRGLTELHPSDLINDLDTAVVQVTANIPGAATPGDRFDVRVSILPGTQTKSLEGGYLWRCDLKRFRAAGPSASIQGKTMAHAEGPIFVNPFGPDGEPIEKADPRTGSVLGGGTVKVRRNIRLELREPSFRMAINVARQINRRFGKEGKIADATSPGTVELDIPRSYRGREERLLALILHLYLREDNKFLEERAHALGDEITRADAPHDDIGLAWEAIGIGALPVVRKLYTDPRPYVRFHAARTGLRLNDEAAVWVLRRQAQDPRDPHQREAIRVLGEAVNFTEAADALRPLLSHEDERVRIWAYLALRERGDRYVEPLRVGAPNFVVDRVRSKGPPLIYARVRQAQRLAVFGEVKCKPPVFYEDSNALFGLHAGNHDKTLTVMRRDASGLLIGEPLSAPLEVVGLAAKMGNELIGTADGKTSGLNLAYSQVARTLYDLCKAGSIDANFRVEKPEDLQGGVRVEEPGRPETDLED
jgi:flagellar basal body P-ring protein FlgI